MDPLGNNKIFAAVLGAALVFMAIRTLPEFVMDHSYPDVPAYSVGPIEVEPEGDGPVAPFPQAEWVAAMDATAGAKVFKKCTSCHNIEAGAPHGTGPNLYNVVMRKSGEATGYGYSAAMASAGYAWDWEHLDGFLEKPSKYLPGTKMNFVGLKKAEDRAAVIEYLRVAADNPVDRPEPAPFTPELTAEAADVDDGVPVDEDSGYAIRDPEATNEELDGDDNTDEIFPIGGTDAEDDGPAENAPNESRAEVLAPVTDGAERLTPEQADDVD